MSEEYQKSAFQSVSLTNDQDEEDELMFHHVPHQDNIGVKPMGRSTFRYIPGSASATSDEEDEPDPMEYLSSKPSKNPAPQVHTTGLALHNLGSSSGTTSTPNGLTPTESASVEQQPHQRIFDRVPNVEENVLFLNPSVISSDDYHRSSDGPLKDSQLQESSLRISNTFEPVRKTSYEAKSNYISLTSSSQTSSSNSSPIEYVLNRSRVLQNELRKNLSLQAKMLESGDSRLSKLRIMIAQNFDQIADNNEALAELYFKELQSTELLYEQFRKWETKRDRLLSKIKLVKNPDNNKHGKKLATLADESREIDKQTVDLELKLQQLRERKALVNQEIELTTSVLESRTSQFVESFKNLEVQGIAAIQLILDQNGVSRAEQGLTIKKIPVDVTFGGRYRKGRTEESVTVQNEVKSHVPVKASDITIQAFEIPDDDQGNVILPTLANRLTSPVPGPGSSPQPSGKSTSPFSPFEKGYVKGTNLSHSAKERLTSFVSDILIPTFNTTLSSYKSNYTSGASSLDSGPSLDDENNTIQEMIDLEPIINLLKHKIAALQDLTEQNSLLSKNYQDYGIIWKDVVDMINQMENKLFNHISTSNMLDNDLDADKLVLNLLSSCLTKIRTRFELQLQSSKFSQTEKNSPLFEALLNEMRAVVSAISMVSGDKSYLQVIDELEALTGKVRSNSNELQINSGKTYDPVPTGFMNTVVDHRMRAELELSKTKEQIAPRPQSAQLKKEKFI